jgi:hypothetical protein
MAQVVGHLASKEETLSFDTSTTKQTAKRSKKTLEAVQCPPSMCEPFSSNPSTTKKKKKKQTGPDMVVHRTLRQED